MGPSFQKRHSKGLLIFVLALSYCVNSFVAQEAPKISAPKIDKLDSSCAILYGNPTSSFNITKDQHISNIEETFQSTKDDVQWTPISSFAIKPGCSLTACNSTDFDGRCKIFESPTDSKPLRLPSDFDDLRSASCTCAKDCKCSDVYIRKTGCGRAYITKGCNTCHAYYMDLKGSKDSVNYEFRNNISSIMVRPGCTLTVYDDEDFEGEFITLEGITKEEWTGGTVASFECVCDANSTHTVQKVPKPPVDYPQPVPLEIPNTLDEISKLTGVHGRHPGLMASLKSFKNKRSPKNAYILLLGLTGSGKSSAINLLFDNQKLTLVGDVNSTTTDIHEFRVPIPVDELGITNSELRVIDTPGLGDTRGLEQDAKFLATLDEFLSGHEELNHRLPNIVLVFGKFHDNRFSGKGSLFVKMLNACDAFRDRLVDKKFSNVIFVLSHFMSVTKDISRRPASRIKAFKKVIEDYSLFPKPISIVLAENKAEEQGLPMLNGYYKLPNGEFYPRNLFDKIQQILTNGEDPIGEAIIRTAFRDSDDFNISAKHFKLFGSDHGKTIKYLNQLSEAAFDINQTETSIALAQAHLGMSTELKGSYPDALPYIQRTFNIRNINHKTDIPKTTLEIVKLLKNIKQNEANTYLMDKAFGLKAPTLKENLITGFSYNVLEDRPLTISPFRLGELKISDAGYMFPNVMSCELEQESHGIIKLFPTRKEYIQARLKSLSVEGTVPEEYFTGIVQPGWNIFSTETSPDNDVNETITITALREHRTFELILNDRLDLTSEFISKVKALQPYNTSNADSVDEWKTFFSTYGTHVVKSTHGGGSIEIQLTTTQSSSLGPGNIIQGMFELIRFAEDVSTGQLSSVHNSTNQTFSLPAGARHALKFKGGDFKYHATDLTSMSLASAADLLENWKESISFIPTILTSEMKLLPISQIAKKVGQNYSSEIQRAAFMLFNSTLKYIPPSQRPTDIPDDRQATTTINSGGNDLTSVLKFMLESQERADARFDKIITQMQAEARDAEIRRENATEAHRKWEREQAAIREQYMQQSLENEKNRQHERDLLQQQFEQDRIKRIERQDAEDREAKLQQHIARQEAARRHTEQMKAIADAERNRPRGGGSCLRKGSKILMWSGIEKSIETVQVGDWLMDGNLNPTQVIGISHEFLMSQNFYGFENTNSSHDDEDQTFFTDSHLFVGANSLLYAISPEFLYSLNPLMEYLSVQEMGEGFHVNRVTRDNGEFQVISSYSRVYKSSSKASADTLVYFLQVDNPEGTYFANGFMARHEIPPFEIWPKTMSVLFTMLDNSDDDILKPITNQLYTMENVISLQGLVEQIDVNINAVINESCTNNYVTNSANITNRNQGYYYYNNRVIKPLEEIYIDSLIYEIFNNPTLSAFAIGVYGRSGKSMADVLDLKTHECFYNNTSSGDNYNFDANNLQVKLLGTILTTIKNHYNSF